MTLKNKKPKILGIMQLPPPIHGQSTMNQIVHKSKIIKRDCNFKTIPFYFAKYEDIGKISGKKIYKTIKYFFQIIFELIYFKPNFVYFPSISTITTAFYRDCLYIFIIKLFKIKIIYHLHMTGFNSKSDKPFENFLYSTIFRNSIIILLSPLLKKDLKQYITSKTLFYYLSNGIEEQIPLRRPDIKNNKYPTILFLSNIEKSKGIFILIDAAKLLKAKGLKFKIILAGNLIRDLSESALNKILSTQNLETCIEYVGPKYDVGKKQLFDQADIFVFPTLPYEAFPLVLLEALQAKLPIISTRVGAIPEIVQNGENGFLVEANNSRVLAEKLELLMNNEIMRKEFGNNGYKSFQKKFRKEIFEKNLVAIYNSVYNKFF